MHSDLLTLQVLYQLPIDGQALSVGRLTDRLCDQDLIVSESEVLKAFEQLQSLGMVKCVEPGAFARSFSTDQTFDAIRALSQMSLTGGHNVGVWMVNWTTGEWEVDEGWLTMLGYSRDDFDNFKNESWQFFCHPDDLPSVLAALHQNIQDKYVTYDIRMRLRHKDGDWLHIQARGRILRPEKKTGIVLIGVHENISERVAADNHIKDLQSLVSKLPVMMFTWLNAPGWPVEFVNDTIATMGYTTDDLLVPKSVAFSDLIHPDDLEKTAEEVTEYLAQGLESYQQIYRIRHKNGQWRWVEDLSWPERDSQGKVRRIHGFLLDITPRVEALEALARTKAQFFDLFEHLPNIAVQGYDEQLRVIFWNKGSEALYQLSAQQTLHKPLADLAVPDLMRTQIQDALTSCMRGQSQEALALLNFRDVQGQTRTVYSSFGIHRTEKQGLEIYRIDIDVSELKQTQQRMALLAQVFSHSYDGVAIANANSVIVEVNDRFCEMTGYDREEIIGEKLSILHSGRQNKMFYQAMWDDLNAKGYWVGQLWNHRKGGEPYAVDMRLSVIRDEDGTIQNYIANATEVTERLMHEESLRQVAYYDSLTGLPNRLSVSESLRKLVQTYQHHDASLAVVYIDLDDFKGMNERHGHAIGDVYLCKISARLTRALRAGDIVARFGGDEFVLVLQNMTDLHPQHPVYERLLAAVSDAVRIGEQVLSLTASFGITFYPQSVEVDADQLLRQADQAMYSAKQRGKNQIVFFDAEFERELAERHTRLQQLRDAVSRGQMVVHYQPQIDMVSGQIRAIEALVRWNHPEHGLQYPDSFLPLVLSDEELSVALSRWVLNRALTDLDALHRQGYPLCLSVNTGIPVQKNLRKIFLDDLRELLEKHEVIPADQITLEIVESALIEDFSLATRTINEIRELGIRISLDDFGTGFSSLAYLKHLTFDEIKIDQSFVLDMLHQRENMTIVQAVISLARSFHVPVVAEGVESEEHAQALLRLGCVLVQGYAFSRPRSMAKLQAWLSEWRPGQFDENIKELPVHRHSVMALLSEHVGWMIRLRDFFQQPFDHPVPADLQSCGMSRILMQLSQEPSFNDVFAALQKNHDELHEYSDKAIAAHQVGDTLKRQTAYQSAEKRSNELQRLIWNYLER